MPGITFFPTLAANGYLPDSPQAAGEAIQPIGDDTPGHLTFTAHGVEGNWSMTISDLPKQTGVGPQVVRLRAKIELEFGMRRLDVALSLTDVVDTRKLVLRGVARTGEGVEIAIVNESCRSIAIAREYPWRVNVTVAGKEYAAGGWYAGETYTDFHETFPVS
jgi:hypothetical protein